MSWFTRLHKLQLDPTSHCNARCGACVRNVYGSDKPGLELKHFNLDVWERIAIEDTKGCHIQHLSLNGNWGDAIMHPHILDIIKIWTTSHPESVISIATNGSIRDKEFWIKLASALKYSNGGNVGFSIDGMEDTHHIYRRKTSYSKLVENIKAFTNADGVAIIYMTLFEHNKHQIEEVKELSRELGAEQFITRPSHVSKMKIIDGKDNYEIEGYYPEIQNQKFSFIENQKPSNYMKHNQINKLHTESKCPWKQAGEIQIDPWGIVWPCCYISKFGGGGSMDYVNLDEVFAPNNNDIIDNAFEQNDLNKHTLKQVLENQWFDTTLDNAIAKSEWKICNETCGI
tara:strand:+ start:901 stop:1926 length:1026 start_codon:yes stop_codon:yes gene_type:complete